MYNTLRIKVKETMAPLSYTNQGTKEFGELLDAIESIIIHMPLTTSGVEVLDTEGTAKNIQSQKKAHEVCSIKNE